MSSLTLNGDTSGSILIQAPAIAGSGTLTLPVGTGTVALISSSTGSGSANGVSSNVYTNIISNITVPNKSLIVANFIGSTAGSNDPANATYGMYISNSASSSGRVARQDGVSTYPKSGISDIAGSLSYFNMTGASQGIWLACYPYASSGYNTPDFTVTYYIVSFA